MADGRLVVTSQCTLLVFFSYRYCVSSRFCLLALMFCVGFWLVLADSGVSTKHLVVLLYQLIKNGQEVRIFI